MRRAMKLCRGLRGPGRRMMSGSLKRLKRKSSTSSSDSGPPRLRKRIPTFSVSAGAAASGWEGVSEGLPKRPKRSEKMLPSGGLETAEARRLRAACLGPVGLRESADRPNLPTGRNPAGAKASRGLRKADTRPKARRAPTGERMFGVSERESTPDESQFVLEQTRWHGGPASPHRVLLASKPLVGTCWNRGYRAAELHRRLQGIGDAL
mmetsp:Transcript_8352/g.21616  ORF Transcript_8352/g.21616 Transcript_8352/m.21616 type:complete len:208 (-) Transcript_8352:5-628(-)